MSYNKFFNKILNNQNNGNVLTFNTQTQSLSFKNNIELSQFENENLKIENNDLTTLSFSKILGSNSTLAFQENLNFTKLKISDLSFENSGDDTLFLLKNENSKIQINSDLEISSSNFKSKKIYGNLKYVNKERTIPWLSGSSNETVKVTFKSTGGYEINKQNANLDNTTYVTCNPLDGFSNYPISDIVTGSSTTYNFINEAGVYTNILYLRPGLNSNNVSKYLTGNEHTFVIDVQKSVLPDWGFEEYHPLLQISSYAQLRTTIMTNDLIKKNSQSIALDMSSLVDANIISPGYKINIFFSNVFFPESLPCIFHSQNNQIDNTNSSWENFTFDSRYCFIEKNDFDSLSSIQKDSFKLNIVDINNQITNGVYSVPYYDTNPTPDFSSSATSNVNTNISTTSKTYNYYRQSGTYSQNRIIINYFKPLFHLNLGNNNIILNEKSTDNLQKNSLLKINNNPYAINENNISQINSVFNKSQNIIKYFISNISDLKNNEVIKEHANLSNQNYSNLQSSTHYNHSSVVFNSKNNLTLKIKVQNSNIDLINFFKVISFSQNLQTFSGIYKTTATYFLSGTKQTKYRTDYYYSYVLKTKQIFNFPFNNLTNSQNITQHKDWYYLNQWKMNKKNYNISDASSNIFDLSLNDIAIENSYSSLSVNITEDKYSIQNFLKNFNADFSTNKIAQISLMYLGYNSETQKNEWIYI